MLVGKEEQLLPLRKGPRHHLRRIGRGADSTAAATHEVFQVGSTVDVGDGHDGVGRAGRHFVPGQLHIVEVGHVCHRAAGAQVGQDHLLPRPRQNVGRFRHEVDAREDNELRSRLGCRRFGKRVGVTRPVGETDDIVHLVMMAENHQPAAKLSAALRNPGEHLVIGKFGIGLARRRPDRPLCTGENGTFFELFHGGNHLHPEPVTSPNRPPGRLLQSRLPRVRFRLAARTAHR